MPERPDSATEQTGPALMGGCLLFPVFPLPRRAPLVIFSGVSGTLDKFTIEAVSAGVADLVLSANVTLGRHLVWYGNLFKEL